MHYGGRNSHRPLSQSEFGRLRKWRDRFYSLDEARLVREVDAGS